ncbi:hypothetical protein OF83DRAFT_1150621 [Amylostereum chailletii]|nr:hypothetical protein OF83DRAFT_1150621 [Amylostereum chailletii]
MTFSSTRAVAVYCGASIGTEPAFVHAATSLGHGLAASNRPLVYGAGSQGIMGRVSGAVLEQGGHVTGIIPQAMLAAGGEGDKTVDAREGQLEGEKLVRLDEGRRERVETIVTHSMHERKVEMARRVCGFIGLPGGFGTFEEVLEVVTWTQIGIHSKPVIILNVLGFYDPLRDLVQGAIRRGFIRPDSESILVFVDGPADHAEHATFDWGAAGLVALEGWSGAPAGYFKWPSEKEQHKEGLQLS